MLRATTHLTITRGSTTNAYGDAVDSAGAVVATNVSAHVTELSRSVRRGTKWSQAVQYQILVPHTTDVAEGDRLTDHVGQVYVVNARTQDRGLGIRSWDLTCDRVTS